MGSAPDQAQAGAGAASQQQQKQRMQMYASGGRPCCLTLHLDFVPLPVTPQHPESLGFVCRVPGDRWWRTRWRQQWRRTSSVVGGGSGGGALRQRLPCCGRQPGQPNAALGQ
jgi:hypothetical protein